VFGWRDLGCKQLVFEVGHVFHDFTMKQIEHMHAFISVCHWSSYSLLGPMVCEADIHPVFGLAILYSG
jgi:hypothetical protein